ncbi:hypothetical protein [Haloferula sp.]|uniref:hypothetical protein n=1 Tax=Haloferula sp. TaxID=2497595 RepID=UPI00329C2658
MLFISVRIGLSTPWPSRCWFRLTLSGGPAVELVEADGDMHSIDTAGEDSQNARVMRSYRNPFEAACFGFVLCCIGSSLSWADEKPYAGGLLLKNGGFEDGRKNWSGNIELVGDRENHVAVVKADAKKAVAISQEFQKKEGPVFLKFTATASGDYSGKGLEVRFHSGGRYWFWGKGLKPGETKTITQKNGKHLKAGKYRVTIRVKPSDFGEIHLDNFSLSQLPAQKK